MRGCGRRRFSSPWHITFDSYSSDLQHNGTETLKFQTYKNCPRVSHSHGGCILLRKSCSKLASWSAGARSNERSLRTDAPVDELNAVWLYKTLIPCPQTGILLFTFPICKPKTARVVMGKAKVCYITCILYFIHFSSRCNAKAANCNAQLSSDLACISRHDTCHLGAT